MLFKSILLITKHLDSIILPTQHYEEIAILSQQQQSLTHRAFSQLMQQLQNRQPQRLLLSGFIFDTQQVNRLADLVGTHPTLQELSLQQCDIPIHSAALLNEMAEQNTRFQLLVLPATVISSETAKVKPVTEASAKLVSTALSACEVIGEKEHFERHDFFLYMQKIIKNLTLAHNQGHPQAQRYCEQAQLVYGQVLAARAQHHSPEIRAEYNNKALHALHPAQFCYYPASAFLFYFNTVSAAPLNNETKQQLLSTLCRDFSCYATETQYQQLAALSTIAASHNAPQTLHEKSSALRFR